MGTQAGQRLLVAVLATAAAAVPACGSSSTSTTTIGIGGNASAGQSGTGTGTGSTSSSGGGGGSSSSSSHSGSGACAYLDDPTASQVAGASVSLVSGSGSVGGPSQCIYGNNGAGATMAMQVNVLHGDGKAALDAFFAGIGIYQTVSGVGDTAGVNISDAIVSFAFTKGTLLVVISSDGGTGADTGSVEKRVEAFARQVAGAM